MTTTELKEKITQLRAEDIDELMDFLKSLQDNELLMLTNEEVAELDRRMADYEVKPESAKPWQKVIGNWQNKI